MNQDLFNAIFGLACAGGGWWFKVIWQTLKDLQEADKQTIEKLSKVELLVAGGYVKREEFDRTIERLFEKLDTIETKIERKLDK